MKLADRITIVTGGASGIGAATVRLFASEGARVAVLDVDVAAAEAVAASIADAVAVEADVSDSAAVDAAVTQVVDGLGRVDVLVHCAGVDVGEQWKQRVFDATVTQGKARAARSPAPTLGLSENLDDESWRRVLAVNLDGTFYCCRAVLRHMVEQRSGVIITMASNAAQLGIAGLPHYVASKAGVIGLTRTLAREFAPIGIRVNAIAPGGVDTPMFERHPEAVRTAATTNAPLGRIASAEEIAQVALFLASDDSSYLVGETVNANGGTFLP
ncbi:MAG: SDR family oxidoreductase [Acidimicrobiia bacterium]